VPPWRAAGATRVVIVSCALGSWVSPCFAFFAGFKLVSPGYLGDPCGGPRQEDHEARHKSRYEVNKTPNNPRTEASTRKTPGTWMFTNEINSTREIFSQPRTDDLSVQIRRPKRPLMAKV
jgi:hypothetical protein